VKKFFMWTAISAGVMVLLPFLSISVLQGYGSMAFYLILLYIANPIYSIVLGFAAGRNISQLWILPIVSSLLFLCGTWIFMGFGEGLFVIYAGAYLLVSMIAMFASSWLKTRKSRNHKSRSADHAS